jgi:hypothetical protein
LLPVTVDESIAPNQIGFVSETTFAAKFSIPLQRRLLAASKQARYSRIKLTLSERVILASHSARQSQQVNKDSA